MLDGTSLCLVTEEVIRELGSKLPSYIDHAITEACELWAPYVDRADLWNYVQRHCDISKSDCAKLDTFLDNFVDRHGYLDKRSFKRVFPARRLPSGIELINHAENPTEKK